MSQWYHSRGDRQSGPVSAKEMKRLAETGWILPSDLVWKEGDTERRPARTYPKLFSSSTVGSTLPEDPRAESPAFDEGSQIEPDPDPSTGVSIIGVAGFFTAMVSIFLGGGASFLYWTDHHRVLVLPIAMLGLLLGNLVLLIDWLRGRARFSLSVLGLALSTVALLTAFVDAGGIPRTRDDVKRVLADLKKPGPADGSPAAGLQRAARPPEQLEPPANTPSTGAAPALPEASGSSPASSGTEPSQQD